jgi:hypothetical protein
MPVLIGALGTSCLLPEARWARASSNERPVGSSGGYQPAGRESEQTSGGKHVKRLIGKRLTVAVPILAVMILSLAGCETYDRHYQGRRGYDWNYNHQYEGNQGYNWDYDHRYEKNHGYKGDYGYYQTGNRGSDWNSNHHQEANKINNEESNHHKNGNKAYDRNSNHRAEVRKGSDRDSDHH